jgi:transposase
LEDLFALRAEYTDWILVQTGGDKERAAEILGVDLSTLYRWQRAATGKGGAVTPG